MTLEKPLCWPISKPRVSEDSFLFLRQPIGEQHGSFPSTRSLHSYWRITRLPSACPLPPPLPANHVPPMHQPPTNEKPHMPCSWLRLMSIWYQIRLSEINSKHAIISERSGAFIVLPSRNVLLCAIGITL